MYFAGVALEEHFSDSGATAVVAVDLERRVVVEHVGVGGLGEQCDDVFVRLVALSEAGPEVDDPCAGPACVSASVGEPVLD